MKRVPMKIGPFHYARSRKPALEQQSSLAMCPNQAHNCRTRVPVVIRRATPLQGPEGSRPARQKVGVLFGSGAYHQLPGWLTDSKFS